MVPNPRSEIAAFAPSLLVLKVCSHLREIAAPLHTLPVEMFNEQVGLSVIGGKPSGRRRAGEQRWLSVARPKFLVERGV
jgi:hypothetical protein